MTITVHSVSTQPSLWLEGAIAGQQWHRAQRPYGALRKGRAKFTRIPGKKKPQLRDFF